MNAETIEKSDPLHERWTSETGLDCVINPCRFSSGIYHLCGYVRIPSGHPLHGLSYNDPCPSTLDATKETVLNGPPGKRGIMDLVCASLGIRCGFLFDVHGSITYSAASAPREPAVPGEYWYGFDCGHCDDDPSIQDSEYVRAECESLARQIAAIGG